MNRLLLLLALMLPGLAHAQAETRNLLQMLDYVGVDYGGAVADGEVVNAFEYDEMRDFAGAIREGMAQLPERAARPALLRSAQQLEQQVQARASAAEVGNLVATLRRTVIREYGVAVEPRRAPDLAAASKLFAENCIACHGAEGRGDGPLGRGMEPPPVDFTDPERHALRTLYGLYNTISLGVADTGMAGYSQFSDDQRWDLAFYVASLGADPAAVARGRAIWERGTGSVTTLEQVATLSPAEAAEQFGPEGADLLAFLRSEPESLFVASPLDFARSRLQESVAVYARGDREAAFQRAVEAYLEGFELAEAGLDASAPELRRDIEAAMTAFRSLLRSGAPVEQVQERARAIDAMLEQAATQMGERTLSGSAAFSGALLVLLREGLEAILVLVALGAFLVKTGRRDALPWLHAGWIAALAAGAVTWWVSAHLVQISGASRELTEAVAALAAAVVLFWVGFWMHSRTQARQWQRFIEESVGRALSGSTLWGLAGLSFVAVYREVFETILFYQAMWVQTDAGGQSMVVAGLGVGSAVLLVLAWLILRYSTRLPLRQFFGATGVLMFVLALVFAGKGTAALQEAGYLSAHMLALPALEWIGFYPTVQTLAAQLGLLSLGGLLLWRSRRSPAAA